MSASLNMLPGSAMFDHGDLAGRDAELLRNPALHNTTRQEPANFAHITVGELRHTVLHAPAPARQAVRDCVKLIAARRSPLQILDAIVGLVAIYVVHLFAVVRGRDERVGNNSVDQFGVRFPPHAKRNLHVSVARDPLAANSLGRFPAGGMTARRDPHPFALDGADTTKVGHFMAAFKAINWTPLFIHARRLLCLP